MTKTKDSSVHFVAKDFVNEDPQSSQFHLEVIEVQGLEVRSLFGNLIALVLKSKSDIYISITQEHL